MKHHIMLDLETMGTSSNAAIIAVGAVEFDPATDTIGRKFYATVGLESSVKHGGVIDPMTVVWWMRQSSEAQREATTGIHDIETALNKFTQFCAGIGVPSDLIVWGNGADFDNVIFSSAFNRLSWPCPWGQWNNRCYRTLKSLAPHIKLQRTGTHHNALDDAESQARHAMQILRAIQPQAIEAA